MVTIECQPYRKTVQPYTLTIHGDHLVYMGETVGTFKDGVIHMEGRNGEIVDATLKGDTLYYQDQMLDFRGNVLWMLEGKLVR